MDSRASAKKDLDQNQVQKYQRSAYVKPVLETHPEYKTLVTAIGGSIPNFAPPINLVEQIDLVSPINLLDEIH
jgi:hypothetical protein